VFKDFFSFNQEEIRKAFKKARLHARMSGFKLLQAPLSQAPTTLSHGKLLIVASRKSGRAHERNKIKRQLKAIFYEEKLYKKPVTSIVIVYKQAMNLTYDQIKEFLLQSFGEMP